VVTAFAVAGMVVDATICVSALSTFATKALRATVWLLLTTSRFPWLSTAAEVGPKPWPKIQHGNNVALRIRFGRADRRLRRSPRLGHDEHIACPVGSNGDRRILGAQADIVGLKADGRGGAREPAIAQIIGTSLVVIAALFGSLHCQRVAHRLCTNGNCVARFAWYDGSERLVLDVQLGIEEKPERPGLRDGDRVLMHSAAHGTGWAGLSPSSIREVIRKLPGAAGAPLTTGVAEKSLIWLRASVTEKVSITPTGTCNCTLVALDVLVKSILVVGDSSRRIASASAGCLPRRAVHARRKARQAKGSVLAAVVLEAMKSQRCACEAPGPERWTRCCCRERWRPHRRSRIVKHGTRNRYRLGRCLGERYRTGEQQCRDRHPRGEVPPPRKRVRIRGGLLAWLTILASYERTSVGALIELRACREKTHS